MTHITKGTWKIGKYPHVVVTDEKHISESNNTPGSKRCYGGALICESILNPADAKLIAAAKDLLEAVKSTQEFFDDMPKGQFGRIVCNVGLMNQMFINISNAIKKAEA